MVTEILEIAKGGNIQLAKVLSRDINPKIYEAVSKVLVAYENQYELIADLLGEDKQTMAESAITSFLNGVLSRITNKNNNELINLANAFNLPFTVKQTNDYGTQGGVKIRI